MDKIIANGVQLILKNLAKDDISFKDKQVLIVGGAGFLGSWLCDVLIEQDAVVVCLDNYLTGNKENIKHHLSNSNRIVEIVEDVCNIDSGKLPLNMNFDIIFHFASPASPPSFLTHPVEILLANTLGTFRLLSITKEHNAKIVFASTSEVYGNIPKQISLSEDNNGNVNPIGIRSCYDESKRAGEAFVKAFERQFGTQAVIIRIFNTYGPRIGLGRVIPNFIYAAYAKQPLKIYGDGFQTRSFAYVTDEVEGILRAAALSGANGEVINLGSDNEMSIQDLAELVNDLIDTKIDFEYHPLPDDDPVRRCPNIQKAKTILGWEPKITIEEGLQKTINWFKLQKITPIRSSVH